MSTNETSQRKADHLDLAFEAQVAQADPRFYYEPLSGNHPTETSSPYSFLGKTMHSRMWVSSMTGGHRKSGELNRLLATACGKYGMGMGLGSCRIILEDDEFLADFKMRSYCGPDVPLYANLGIAQIEEILRDNRIHVIQELIERTETDGLIVHLNPIQEWVQPEGDRIHRPIGESLEQLLGETQFPVIVKEVGQGMGPESLKKLISMKVAAIDFGAFGGTNFALLELLRQQNVDNAHPHKPLVGIGHTATEMVEFCNDLLLHTPKEEKPSFILSGGVRNYLDGYYLTSKLQAPSVYAHASAFLAAAQQGENHLHQFIESQLRGFAFANQFLTVRT